MKLYSFEAYVDGQTRCVEAADALDAQRKGAADFGVDAGRVSVCLVGDEPRSEPESSEGLP